MKSYFNCHTHTAKGSNLRLLDSTNRPQDVINKAIELGLSGVAFTEHEFVGNAVEINKIAKELKQTNPDFVIALGNEIYLTDTRENGQKYYHFILIAKDALGHKMLRELSSTSWYYSYVDRGIERVPTLKSELKSLIEKYGKHHLIATTACIGGEVSQNALLYDETMKRNDQKNALKYLQNIDSLISFCKELFDDDFYIECSPATNNEQMAVNKRLIEIADVYEIKVVVGTDAHYLTPSDRWVHKAYLNSKDGEREVDDFYEFCRLMSYDDVCKYLSQSIGEDKTFEVLENTLEIQNKIEFFDLFDSQNTPSVKVKEYPKVDKGERTKREFPTLYNLFLSDDTQDRYWVNQCVDKIKEMFPYTNRYDGAKPYLIELEEEARVKTVIGQKLNTNMFRYPNTLQHYIGKIWNCGSMVGAGRGSSCAALNHYLMGITQLDPIKWNLPFFRYMNDERVELGSLILILPSCK